MDLRVNGLRFHVDDEGTGPPVILLHGWPDTSRVWRRQVEALVRAGFRAVTPDMRGRGRSEKPQDVAQYLMPVLVSDVVGILDALGIERAHVVGHDWGSPVAWFVAHLHPSRVDHLVDIGSGNPAAAPRLTLPSLQRASHRILFQFQGAAETLLPQDGWYLLRALLNGSGDFDEAVKALSEPGALTAGFNWYRANAPLERLVAPPPKLGPITAPTLAVWGAKCPYVLEERLLNSARTVTGPWRYERFDDAGHWVQLDQPDKSNRLLIEFLSS
jgi:pimeloyl-ACP methyl ester carboxylesterase